MIPEELESVRVLRLEPGDMIVASIARDLTMAEAQAVKAQLTKSFPDHEIVLLANGLELATLRALSANDDNG